MGAATATAPIGSEPKQPTGVNGFAAPMIGRAGRCPPSTGRPARLLAHAGSMSLA